MKKIFAVTLAVLLVLAAAVSVSAADTTVFQAAYYADDSEITLEIRTNYTTGVGGLDMQLNYDTDAWKVTGNGGKTSANGAKLSKSEGSVRLIWYTVTGDELPETLLQITLKKVSQDASLEDIALVINEYYDNTVQMTDLSYEVKPVADNSLKPSSWGWIVAAAAAVIVLAGCGVYGYQSRKRKLARRRRRPVPAQLHAENIHSEREGE